MITSNLRDTVFNLPKFYHYRITLFKICTIIWGETEKISALKPMYEVLHQNLSDVDVPKHYLLQRFFLDLVGILQGIKRSRNKRIIIEYACTDFQ